MITNSPSFTFVSGPIERSVGETAREDNNGQPKPCYPPSIKAELSHDGENENGTREPQDAKSGDGPTDRRGPPDWSGENATGVLRTGLVYSSGCKAHVWPHDYNKLVRGYTVRSPATLPPRLF